MDEAAIATYITATFPEVETSEAFGYTFFFYGPDRMLPFATLAASDNDHDRVSHLDRPGVYRLNIGVGRKTFQSLFGSEGVVLGDHDFTTLDRIMPHPEYAAQSFVCVLNPGENTLQTVQGLLAEAHALAAQRHARREKPG